MRLNNAAATQQRNVRPRITTGSNKAATAGRQVERHATAYMTRIAINAFAHNVTPFGCTTRSIQSPIVELRPLSCIRRISYKKWWDSDTE